MVEKPPKVSLLKAFRPDQHKVADTTLSYPNLGAKVIKHSSYDAARWEQFLIEDDELAQAAHAEELASQYLLQTSLQLNEAYSPELKEMWSRRFTEASIELFGRPDPEIANQLFAQQRQEFEALKDNPHVDQSLLKHVLATYAASEVEMSAETKQPEDFSESAKAFKTFLEEEYKEELSVFDSLDDEAQASPAETAELFTRALDKLKAKDSAWNEWAVEITDTTSLAIVSKSKRIRVGKNRVPFKASEIRGLFGHEVLVHTKRAIEARRLGDEELALGLPNYLQGEEGVAIFIETSLNGQVPTKIINRYVDTAIALGDILPQAFTRQELFDFVMTREIVRAQAEQQTNIVDISSLQKQVWEHVNRIYRGSSGDEHIGVFTKDALYYAGFKDMAKYIHEKLQQGMSVDQLFTYLTVGKFNPLNPLHVKRLVTS